MFSDYAATALLNSLLGKSSNLGASALAPSVYVALLTALPTPATAGSALTEASYTGYARVAAAASAWAAAGGRVIANSGTIQFPNCAGGSSTISGFALVDAATNGNVIAYGELTQSQTISGGNITLSGTTATVSLTAHGYSTGNAILISGCEQPEYDGWQIITRVDANTFTYTVANSPASPATAASGQTLQASIATTLAVSNNIQPQLSPSALLLPLN